MRDLMKGVSYCSLLVYRSYVPHSILLNREQLLPRSRSDCAFSPVRGPPYRSGALVWCLLSQIGLPSVRLPHMYILRTRPRAVMIPRLSPTHILSLRLTTLDSLPRSWTTYPLLEGSSHNARADEGRTVCPGFISCTSLIHFY